MLLSLCSDVEGFGSVAVVPARPDLRVLAPCRRDGLNNGDNSVHSCRTGANGDVLVRRPRGRAHV